MPLELEIRVDAARALLHARQFVAALELLGDTPQRAEQLGFKLFAAEALSILTAAQKQITD